MGFEPTKPWGSRFPSVCNWPLCDASNITVWPLPARSATHQRCRQVRHFQYNCVTATCPQCYASALQAAGAVPRVKPRHMVGSLDNHGEIWHTIRIVIVDKGQQCQIHQQVLASSTCFSRVGHLKTNMEENGSGGHCFIAFQVLVQLSDETVQKSQSATLSFSWPGWSGTWHRAAIRNDAFSLRLIREKPLKSVICLLKRRLA